MAFTGTATVKQISDGIVRITGLSLAAGAAGTIGLHGNSGTPGVTLPTAFQPAPYEYAAAVVPLQDSIECLVQEAATGVAVVVPLSVVKTGTTNADFLITITNNGAAASPNLEMYV